MTDRSPVPDAAADELRRVALRWQQLPEGHARACMPLLRAELGALLRLAEGAPVGGTELIDAAAAGEAAHGIPDLGPAVVIDQLRVLTYDAAAAGHPEGLAGRLRALLRAINSRVEEVGA